MPTKAKTAGVLVILIIATATTTYLVWAYTTDYPPFCSGYPPGGNCPATWKYDFLILVNYTGSWEVTYYGYRGGPSNPNDTSSSYTSGKFTGVGLGSRTITLSGPNNNGLTLCAVAKKLDSSNDFLQLKISIVYKNTTLPHGSVYVCGAVAP